MPDVSAGDPVDSRDREWRAGDPVIVRGARWIVDRSVDMGGCRAMRLVAVDRARNRRTILLPFDRPKRIVDPQSMEVMRPRRWRASLLGLAMNARPLGGLTVAVNSAIDILPYQLEAPVAMLRYGVNRLMIADDVGLGKTVQAGLIVAALAAEQEAFRALIVTPAGLRDQWDQELSQRFALRPCVAGSLWLSRIGRELPRDVNPWSMPGIYVCSYEYLRRPEVLRPLEEVAWGALVLDEAHAAAIGTARRAAVHAIALRSKRVVLLTATPHAGDDEQFRALCRIGSADGRDRLTLFRRTRRQVTSAARRRTRLLPVHLSDAERRVHRLLEAYTSLISRESHARGDEQARLVAILLRKRALSGIGSLAISCQRRVALLYGSEIPAAGHQLQLSFEDDESLRDELPDAALAVPGLADPRRERACLESIAAAAAVAALHDSKLVFLVRFMRRVTEPVIVFTEYRDTLEQIRRVLLPSRPDVLALHGGMPPSERSAVQQDFNRGGSLLLATDAAAEGLNLQHRCRTVVHFELPWSPVRLEQRAGRVDRIGQRRTIHELMLVADDTAERLVLAPLIRRAVRARAAGSGMEALTESHVAAAVMEGERVQPSVPKQPDTIDAPTPEVAVAAAAEAMRIADLRKWNRGTGSRDPGRRIPATVLRSSRSGLPPGIVAVYTLALAAPDGSIAHSEIVAFHHTTTAPLIAPAPSQLRAVLRSFTALEPALRSRQLGHLQQRIDGARDLCGRVSASMEERERIAAAPIISAARQIVQAGLFERRALRGSTDRREAAAAFSAEVEQRLDSLRGHATLTPALHISALLLLVP